jgi:hypothetical protein
VNENPRRSSELHINSMMPHQQDPTTMADHTIAGRMSTSMLNHQATHPTPAMKGSTRKYGPLVDHFTPCDPNWFCGHSTDVYHECSGGTTTSAIVSDPSASDTVFGLMALLSASFTSTHFVLGHLFLEHIPAWFIDIAAIDTPSSIDGNNADGPFCGPMAPQIAAMDRPNSISSGRLTTPERTKTNMLAKAPLGASVLLFLSTVSFTTMYFLGYLGSSTNGISTTARRRNKSIGPTNDVDHLGGKHATRTTILSGLSSSLRTASMSLTPRMASKSASLARAKGVRVDRVDWMF